jgi:hypothetical protein
MKNIFVKAVIVAAAAAGAIFIACKVKGIVDGVRELGDFELKL